MSNEPKFKVGDTLVLKMKVISIDAVGGSSDRGLVTLSPGPSQSGHEDAGSFYLDNPAIQQAEVIPAPYRPKVGEKFHFFKDDVRDPVTALYVDEQGVLYTNQYDTRYWADWIDDRQSVTPYI